jgi:glycosyltransferase involved in cell wall biosynthesis
VDPGPFFTIGVTTYKRPEFLRECISSLLSQSFGGFEVLVGNNDDAQPLVAEQLGTHDDRVRVINHPRNLGQIGNMNALLHEGRGRYFTWLADDDLYSSQFLSSVKRLIDRFHEPDCVVTGYHEGKVYVDPGEPDLQEAQLLSGTAFRGALLRREIRVLGCYAVYQRPVLLKLEGMEMLGGSSLYSDHLLSIKAGSLASVVHLTSPLLFFRHHDDSLSFAHRTSAQIFAAQRDLIAKSRKWMHEENTLATQEIYLLLAWCMRDMSGLLSCEKRLPLSLPLSYVAFIREIHKGLSGTSYYWHLVRDTIEYLLRILWMRYIKQPIINRLDHRTASQ